MAGVHRNYTSKNKELTGFKVLDMRQWRKGRRAGIRNQCPRGVWVRVPPCVPMRSYTWILKIKLPPMRSERSMIGIQRSMWLSGERPV